MNGAFDSDDEDDDTMARAHSLDMRRHEDDVLKEEEEQEKLLMAAQAQSKSFNRLGGKRPATQGRGYKAVSRKWTAAQRTSFRDDDDEDRELMYDAHERNKRVRSSFSESPSGWRREKTNGSGVNIRKTVCSVIARSAQILTSTSLERRFVSDTQSSTCSSLRCSLQLSLELCVRLAKLCMLQVFYPMGPHCSHLPQSSYP